LLAFVELVLKPADAQILQFGTYSCWERWSRLGKWERRPDRRIDRKAVAALIQLEQVCRSPLACEDFGWAALQAVAAARPRLR
jgi:hypothetical protein